MLMHGFTTQACCLSECIVYRDTRPMIPHLGSRELDVLWVLWTLGSGTTAEVRAQLPARLAYNTVLTILRNLEAKSVVRHRTEGRVHRYEPVIALRETRQAAVHRLCTTLFHGAPRDLWLIVLSEQPLSDADRQWLVERLARSVAGDGTG